MGTRRSRSGIWIGCAIGVLATAAVVGLAIAGTVGADLVRFTRYVAAVFFVAGLLGTRATTSSAAGRAIAIAAGGIVPVVALAATGVAFASAIWLVAYVVVATAFALAGAVARAWVGRGASLRAAIVAAAAWCVLLAAGRSIASRVVAASTVQHVAQPVAPFALISADGGELRSGDARGRVVVLAFWATWGAPCRAELPELAAVADHYRADPRVVVWWVNTGRDGDTLDGARAFAAGLPARSLALAFDRDHVAGPLGVTGLPAIAMLGRDGRLRVRHTGYDASEGLTAAMIGEIDRLLADG